MMKRLVVLLAALACALLAPASGQAKQGSAEQKPQAECPFGVTNPQYCTAGYEKTVLEDLPLAYWRLGDAQDLTTMSDVMGEYPGTYMNGSGGSAQLGVSGESLTAALFVGEGQYAYVNNIKAPESAYTMEAWVRPTDGKAMMIMQQGAAGALFINPEGRYTFVPDSNEVGLQLVDANAEDVAYLHGEAEKFHQVIGTRSAGGVATLYVDGKAVASAPASGAPSGYATFYVGYGTLAPWARGYIDEAVYYGHALSAERVLAHYEADPPPPLLTRRAHKSSTSSGSSSGGSSAGPTAGASKQVPGRHRHKRKASRPPAKKSQAKRCLKSKHKKCAAKKKSHKPAANKHRGRAGKRRR